VIELVEKDKPKGIWTGDMEDGDVGVIVSWLCGTHLGRIVQRYKNNLVSIGRPSGNGWSLAFKRSFSFS